MSGETATIFDVQRFCVHDGPGIRTVIFFKGCGMRCVWCQNPEGIRSRLEMAYYAERCRSECSACVPVCEEAALRPTRADRLDFRRCTVCGRCVEVCTAEALQLIGRRIGADALLAEVLKDRSFYDSSGGGITLSGGEPVQQGEFLQSFLPRAKEAGLHVVLETAGCYRRRALEPLLPFVDLVLFDLKLADAAAHRRWTKRSNRLVLENLLWLLGRGQPLKARMPLIPGYNTAPEQIAAAAGLLRDLGLRQLDLLRYNHLWEAKLPRLATSQGPLVVPVPDDAQYAAIVDRFHEHGITAGL